MSSTNRLQSRGDKIPPCLTSLDPENAHKILVMYRVQLHTADLVPYFQTRSTRERRPPWPRQIITPMFPNIIMLSLVVKG